MTIELTKEEINVIIIGMINSQYPIGMQKRAFELVFKLRDLLLGENT